MALPPNPPQVPPHLRAAARRALALSDEALVAECTEEFFVAGGPGGQHRNKTETGVRLTHPATGLVVTATERRSQLQNRGAAIERLKQKLAALTIVQAPRRATKPTWGSVQRRMTSKKHAAQRKTDRKGDW